MDKQRLLKLAGITESCGSSHEEEESISRLVDEYRGILDQDGWETLELTVRDQHPKQADAIIAALQANESEDKCKCGCNPDTCKCKADCKCGCNAVKESEQLDEGQVKKEWRAIETALNKCATALVKSREAEDEDNAKEILDDFCQDYINNVM